MGGTAAAVAANPDETTSLVEAVGALVEAYSNATDEATAKRSKGDAGIPPPLRADAIRACMGCVDEAFLRGQQDAAEFMVNWLVQLADSLNRIPLTPTKSPRRGARHPPLDAMQAEFGRESSFIDEALKSQLEGTHVCMKCGRKSHVYEHPLSVDLDIRQGPGGKARMQSFQTINLSVLLSEFCGGEKGKDKKRKTIHKYCEQCSPAENVQHKHTVRWTSLPPVLIFVLKRYAPLFASEDAESAQKIHARVEFPLDCLDMKPYSAADAVGHQYRLVGVVDHIGQTLREGHYTATCARWPQSSEGVRAQPNGKHQPASWVHFDDKSVQKASSHRVVTCSSYILVYQCLSHAGAPPSELPKPNISGISSEDEL